MTPADGLNPAFFRGVSFFVEKSADTSSRAFEVKSFPRRPGARVSDDDLGPRDVVVDAYIVAWGDGAAASERFRAAMMAPGLGLLSLPTTMIPRAGCAKCEQGFESQKLGLLKFKLTFVVDDEETGAPALGVLAAEISAAAGDLLSALPDIIAPVGMLADFAEGVAIGLDAAIGIASEALPGVVFDVAAGVVLDSVAGVVLDAADSVLNAGLGQLMDAAHDLAMAGTVAALNVAERLAR